MPAMPRKLARQTTQTSSSSGLSLQNVVPPSLADASQPLPRLIVFDLDYTLWPFWVDTHVTPPLKPNAQHTAAADRFGEEYAFYADVPSILQAIPQLPANPADENDATTHASAGGGVKLGVASRTCAPALARELLKMLHLTPPLLPDDGEQQPQKTPPRRRALDVFDAGLEIYPTSKIKHFEALQKRTGVRFEDMLFFDDEARNRDTETLGVTMWLVRDGVTWDEVEKGVAEWRRRRGYKPN
jgi:magnesium-dependent phosphatase 1